MEKDRKLTSLVLSLPYNHASSDSIWNSAKQLLPLLENFAAVRLRIWNEKSACSLNAYEAAYTYCPNKAILVTSRLNINF